MLCGKNSLLLELIIFAKKYIVIIDGKKRYTEDDGINIAPDKFEIPTDPNKRKHKNNVIIKYG